MTFRRLFRALILISGGFCLILVPYLMYTEALENASIKEQSPIVKVPVISRMKGGARMFANLEVYYQAELYNVHCPNSFFRKTIAYDSVRVHYDETKNKLILADVPIRTHYWFWILLASMGGWSIFYAINILRSVDSDVVV